MSNDNGNARPLPKGWLAKVNALRKDLLARGFMLTPKPPKGPRASGPHLGPWYESRAQAEMVLRDEGLLSPERCAGCGQSGDPGDGRAPPPDSGGRGLVW